MRQNTASGKEMAPTLTLALALALALAGLRTAHASVHMERAEVDIDLKPNGQHASGVASMVSEQGGAIGVCACHLLIAANPFLLAQQVDENGYEITCKFSWAVVGGTNEQWVISLERKGGEYTCTVAR